MKKEEIKSQILTIPNILTFIRILAVPFFMWLTIDKKMWVAAGEYSFPIIGFAIMLFAAATDVVDGHIARKYNQTTALGAAIDPVADKLMHVATLICLVVIGFVHWAFLVLIFLKELLMVIGGFVVLKYAQPIKANMAGKVASATLSLGVFLSFFHPIFAKYVFYLDWIVIGIATVMTYYAFAGYVKQVIPVYKIIFKAFKEGKDPNDYFSQPEEDNLEKTSNNEQTVEENDTSNLNAEENDIDKIVSNDDKDE